MMVSSKTRNNSCLTSLTVEAFDILLPSFSQAWNDYVKKNYVNSGVANQRSHRLPTNCSSSFSTIKSTYSSGYGCYFWNEPRTSQFLGRRAEYRAPKHPRNCAILPNRRPPQLKEALEACGCLQFIIMARTRAAASIGAHRRKKTSIVANRKRIPIITVSLSIEMRKPSNISVKRTKEPA